MSLLNFSCGRLQSTFLWINILTTWWCWPSWPTAPSSPWPSPSTRRSEWWLMSTEQSRGVTHICSQPLSARWLLQYLYLNFPELTLPRLWAVENLKYLTICIFWVAFKFPTIGRDYLICKSERNLSSNFRFNYAISSSLSSIWDKARC